MERPQPKELVVSDVHTPSRLIIVTVGSEDARSWLLREGTSFGLITTLIENRYYLFVNATYDLQEVAAWLRSYNDPR